jgi:biopolymer transport protein ExbD
MKRTILILALFAAIAAVAQPGPPPPPKDALPAYLNLTADQKVAWDAAHKEFEAEMKAAHDRLDQKLGAVLTPEQKSKYDSFTAAMRFMHEQHGPPHPPPH